jgi:uncharacterized protein YbcI
MVRLYKESYGKGPTKARTYVSGDMVVCLLKGGLLPGERTLRDAGRADAVVLQREAVQEVLRHRFVETIEALTGRRVASFISGIDVESEINAEIFVLEPIELDTGDERDAVKAWARQTRRHAQELRDRTAALREPGRRSARTVASGARLPIPPSR